MRPIDADALKMLVDKEWFDCREKYSFVDEINRTPSIDLVKRGEWVYREIRDYPIAIDRVGCSNCGWRFYSHPYEKDDQHRADGIMVNYRYCPRCGAKMQEERYDEDQQY